MSDNPIGAVLRHFGLAWRLKVPLVLAQLSMSILLVAFLSPVLTLTMRGALALSGQPALADFDIAHFLLSPVGFAALLIVGGLALALSVLNAGVMMGVALDDRLLGTHGFLGAIGTVLPQLPRLVMFAALFLVRILLLTLPFLAVAGGIYLAWLTEYDINYYLTYSPPEFVRAVVLIGAVLVVMGLVLVWKLAGWALALPMVVFDGTAPRRAFAASVAGMKGRRRGFILRLVIWGAVSVVVIAVPLAVTGAVASRAVVAAGHDLSALVRVLLVVSAIWAAINLLVNAIAGGALAILVMDTAGWPGTAAQAARPVPRWLAPALWIGVAVAAVVTATGAYGLRDMGKVGEVAVIAHRGAAGARPENTMAAVEKAIEDGTDWVEIDVQETADGEVIVIHDSDFMKIAGNPIKVWEATMQDVAEIDIGSWFDPTYAGERAPTLRAVLEAARDRAGVLIELKYYGHNDKLEQRVADIVAATGMEDQVMAMSLKMPLVEEMKSVRPDWPAGLLASAALGRMWELDVDFLAVNAATVSMRLVRETRARGKALYVWTVDDAISMSAMASLGVSGLITNEPALARQVLAQRRELSGAERLVLFLADRIGLESPVKAYRDDSP